MATPNPQTPVRANTILLASITFALGIVVGILILASILITPGCAPQIQIVTIVVTATPAQSVSAGTTSSVSTAVAQTTDQSSSPARSASPPGPTLPRALTATPLPTRLVSFVITQEQATEHAANAAANAGLAIEDLRVVFTPQEIVLEGTVEIPPLVQGLPPVSAPIQITGKPECADQDLRFVVQSVEADNLPIGEAQLSQVVEQIVNETFADLVKEKRVQDCLLGEGTLTLQISTTPSPSALGAPTFPLVSPTLDQSPGKSSTPKNSSVLTPGPTLPKAISATPPPTRLASFDITQEQATDLAVQVAMEANIPIKSLSITFTPPNIVIKGIAEITSPVRGLQPISAPITIKGKPECADENLRFVIISVDAGNLPIGEDEIRRSVEQVVNEIFFNLVKEKRVQDCPVSEGKLTVVYSETQK